MIRRNYIRFAAGAMILIVALSVARYSAQTAVSQIPVYGYQVVHTYPHDPSAFTQGLIFLDGVLYESTGGTSRSRRRKVQRVTGTGVLHELARGAECGEGAARGRFEKARHAVVRIVSGFGARPNRSESPRV